jgi:hypothetical protein
MDLSLLQPAQQLFLLWKTMQQKGTLTITRDHITWTNDTTTTDLTPLFQNSTIHTKKRKRDDLSDYYQLGKRLKNDDGGRELQTLSSSKVKTARRTYELIEFIGEDNLEKLPHINPSQLTRLSNAAFEELKFSTFLSTFGGPQDGEGDDLSSVFQNPSI